MARRDTRRAEEILHKRNELAYLGVGGLGKNISEWGELAKKGSSKF